MSEIQSVEGRPVKKGMSPGRTSAVGALIVLGGAIAAFFVSGLLRPAPIPADHVLAIVAADGAIELALADGSAAAPLVAPAQAAGATALRWAPGGDFVAIRGANDLVVVDREGVVAWRQALRSRAARFAWSPDGARIAIYDAAASAADTDAMTVDAAIDVVGATGTLEWRIPLPDGFQLVTGFDNLAWSPDGTAVAFTGATRRVESGRQPAWLWIADVRAQTFRQVTDEADAFDYGPAWGKGGLVIARSSSLESGIWRVDPTTAERADVLRTAMELCPVHAPCSPANLDPLVPSPSGRDLAFHEPTFGLSVLTVETHKLVRVAQPGTVASGPVWSADGAGLLYLRHVGATPDPSNPPELLRFDLATATSAVVLPGVLAFDLLSTTP